MMFGPSEQQVVGVVICSWPEQIISARLCGELQLPSPSIHRCELKIVPHDLLLLISFKMY